MTDNPIVTPKSVAISLSAPRVPPFGTVQHGLLVGRGLPPRSVKHQNGNTDIEVLRKSLSKSAGKIPFPHLPKYPPERLSRWLVMQIPLQLRNRLRDEGGLRFLADFLLIVATAPPLAAICPYALYKFILMSVMPGAGRKVTRVGPHWRQHVELYLPEQTCRRLVFFVHGGAWGSGFAWMYRLVAVPFLEQGWGVALPNYRTYPDGDVHDHIQDLELAASELYNGHSFEKVVMVAHSSAAHTSLLMLVERLLRKAHQVSPTLEFDAFLGLSGPYSISDHFYFEASRGVEEYSPMKPACGSTPEKFRKASPCLRMLDALASSDETQLSWKMPPITLMHGMDDTTVPFTATSDAARLLQSMGISTVEEVYLPGVGHQDVPIQCMLGGICKDFVVEWVRRQEFDDASEPDRTRRSPFYIQSRL